MTVAPVVVSPDIASKKASVKPSGVSASISGRVAKPASRTQLTVVSRNPSRGERLSGVEGR